MANLTETIVHFVERFVERPNSALGLLLLGACSAVEYLFPPFPGDTITLLGAFLAATRGWSWIAVFLATLVGSGLGAMGDFYFGRWLHRHRRRRPRGRHAAREGVDDLRSHRPAVQAGEPSTPDAPPTPRLDWLLGQFRRHGELYIVLNRFLPTVRSLFFVAAGMAELRPARVLLFAVLSAALWNGLLFAVVAAVGPQWERLVHLAKLYANGVWALLALLAVGAALRFGWRRLRRRRQGDAGPSQRPPDGPPPPPSEL
jgi:membrane protein DedA with SNARE-associated domain